MPLRNIKVLFFGMVTLMGIVLSGCTSRDERQFEKTLGIAPPKETNELHIWIDRRPDYNYVEFKARLNSPQSAWPSFCSKLGLTKKDTESLADQRIDSSIAAWWNIPAPGLQRELAGKIDERGIVRALWWEGYIYIEFAGYPPAKR